jgi:hypothetical protein
MVVVALWIVMKRTRWRANAAQAGAEMDLPSRATTLSLNANFGTKFSIATSGLTEMCAPGSDGSDPMYGFDGFDTFEGAGVDV